MLARSALAGFLLSCAAAASAVPIDSVGDSFAVSFDGSVKGVLTPGLTASASFLVTEFDGAAGRVVLQISLSNTTDTTLFKQARVSALGFDVDATLSGASASGLFGHALLGSQFPSQFGPVDVCAIGNPNSCSSGRNAGALLGQSGVVTLTLSFAGPLTALDLSNFGVRYQTLEPVGPFIEDSGTGHGTVPEPRVLALLGAAGLALFGRRRR